jgi:DnaK suppressor protein
MKLKHIIETLKNQEYMSVEQIAAFKEHLNMRKLEVEASQISSREELATMEKKATDPADAATIQENLDRINRNTLEQANNMKQVQQAFNYIRLGDYGFCESCGGEIGLSRLVSVPTATRDAVCANAHEMQTSILRGNVRIT